MVFLSGFFQAIFAAGVLKIKIWATIETAALNTVNCLIHLNWGVRSEPEKLLVEI